MVGKRDGKTLIKKIFIELRTAFITIFELSKIKISISIKKYKKKMMRIFLRISPSPHKRACFFRVRKERACVVNTSSQ